MAILAKMNYHVGEKVAHSAAFGSAGTGITNAWQLDKGEVIQVLPNKLEGNKYVVAFKLPGEILTMILTAKDMRLVY